MSNRDLIGEANALLKPEAQSRRLAPQGECAECDGYRVRGETFHPSHTPSNSCQSGKRPHCTCDACF